MPSYKMSCICCETYTSAASNTPPPLDYYYYNNFAYHPHIVFAYHHHPNDKFFGWSWLLLLVQVLVFISRKPCYLISAPNCVTY